MPPAEGISIDANIRGGKKGDPTDSFLAVIYDVYVIKLKPQCPSDTPALNARVYLFDPGASPPQKSIWNILVDASRKPTNTCTVLILLISASHELFTVSASIKSVISPCDQNTASFDHYRVF